MVYTLLGIPCWLGFSLGSKRAYNPKEVTHQTCLINIVRSPSQRCRIVGDGVCC
jgi:hypothetical protein